ncbi:MAG: hypothetical protein JXA79_08870 [Deltaproteobacteria bacterium]|nr:hypothetical protein [Deltaproteobacteria bacterium]
MDRKRERLKARNVWNLRDVVGEVDLFPFFKPRSRRSITLQRRANLPKLLSIEQPEGYPLQRGMAGQKFRRVKQDWYALFVLSQFSDGIKQYSSPFGGGSTPKSW